MTEPKPGIKLDGRTPSDPQVGLADQVVSLIPTPNAVDGDGKGSSQQSVDSLRRGVRQQHLTDFPRLLDIHGGDSSTQMELFHTPDTMPDAPNKGSNTRSKPAGVGNQVKELPAPDDGDESLLPTPTTGYSGRDPDKWRRERKPSSVGNTRKITDLQVAMVEMERGEPDVELLPTPTSSQGRNETSGRQPGSAHNTGTTLNDVVFKGDIASIGEPPLLPTPVAADSNGHIQDPAADVGNNGRSVSLGDVVSRLPDGSGPLFRTPNVSDGNGGGSDPSTRGQHQIKLSDQVLGLPQDPLLPTPRTSDAKGTDSPAERNRKSPGLGAIGFHLPDADSDPGRAGEELMGTPQARDWKGVPGRNFNSHNLARDVDEMLRSESPGTEPGDGVALLPTPNVAAREVRNSPGEMARVNPALGAVVADLAENGDQSRFHGGEEVKLLPTPTTLDHVEKRTTHAGGNPTLQGAVCGTNPVDAERLGLSTEDGAPLLPTPKTAEKRTSRRAALESHSRSGPSMGQALEIAQGVLPHEFQSWEELPPGWQPELLPTPVVNDMGDGKTPEQWDEWTDRMKARHGNGNGHGRSLSVEVQRAAEGELLPTPQTRDATGGKPEAVGRGRGYGANLNDVAAAGLLPDGEVELTPVPDPAQVQIISLLETVIELLRGQAR